MTVQELIDRLNEIEDKSAEVIMASEDYLPIKEVWIFPDEIWLCTFSKNL